jgi:hypothetical protein
MVRIGGRGKQHRWNIDVARTASMLHSCYFSSRLQGHVAASIAVVIAALLAATHLRKPQKFSREVGTT